MHQSINDTFIDRSRINSVIINEKLSYQNKSQNSWCPLVRARVNTVVYVAGTLSLSLPFSLCCCFVLSLSLSFFLHILECPKCDPNGSLLTSLSVFALCSHSPLLIELPISPSHHILKSMCVCVCVCCPSSSSYVPIGSPTYVINEKKNKNKKSLTFLGIESSPPLQ